MCASDTPIQPPKACRLNASFALYLFLLVCYCLCYNHINDPGAIDVWKTALNDGFCVSLCRDEAYMVHKEFHSFFDNLKGWDTCCIFCCTGVNSMYCNNYKERESVLYHGIKTPCVDKTVSKRGDSQVFLTNFDVFWDRGNRLFQVLYIASQTNQYFKEKIEVESQLSLWTFFTTVSKQVSELSECKNVLSECKNLLSQCKNLLSECKNLLSQCKNLLSRCKNLLSRCKNLLSECKNLLSLGTNKLIFSRVS